MGASRNILAFDAGGGSSRIQQIGFTGEKLFLKQLARFDNGPITVGDSLYWDILGIYRNLKNGLQIASKQGMKFSSLGIDTWGNDFVLFDKELCMLENPYSYRDKRTNGCVEEVNHRIGGRELFLQNGIQQVRMNTMYQLFSLVKNRPHMLEIADKLLFIPDLLAWFLTGELHNEYTMATISQLYSYEAADWNYQLMSKLGIPSRLFSSIVMPGTEIGNMLSSVCSDTGSDPMKLIAVGSHDTGSAVAAVPAPEGSPLYISSGTWSIVGTETDEPVISTEAYEFNCANEGGVNGKIRLLKNVMGLWIIQEIQRRFAIEGRSYTFDELSRLASASKSFGSVIDPDDGSFYEPVDMPGMIREYCSRTGQVIPQDDGSLVRTVLESLAFKYRYVIEGLERLTKRSFDKVYIIGGGAANKVLCSFTANCCNKTVLAGPTEATALGNGLVQLVSLGDITDYDQARDIVKSSFPPEVYLPRDTEQWDEQYHRFLSVTGLN